MEKDKKVAALFRPFLLTKNVQAQEKGLARIQTRLMTNGMELHSAMSRLSLSNQLCSVNVFVAHAINDVSGKI